MRVTFQAAHREATAGINKANERLLEFQRQVSTSKRVEKPSDDPSAAAAAAVERSRLGGIDRYSQAADSALSRLSVADTVLSDIVEQLTAAQSTVLSARGTTQTQLQRDARALALEGLRDAMLRDLNTQFRGQYLFGGATGTTQPFVKDAAGAVSAYQGSTVEVSIDIDTQQEVGTAFDGDALTRGADADDLFVAMERAITAARTGDESGLGTALEDLERAFVRVTTLQSRVGAWLNAVEDGKARLADASRASQKRISALEDANMVEAITGMTDAETVYRSALSAAGRFQNLSLMDYLK